MFKYLSQIWNAKELKQKILFSLFILIVYRAVTYIPVPGIDVQALQNLSGNSGLDLLSLLTGGSISQFSIVLMGLSPYINASIIMQLLTVIVPKLETLSKEGEQGRNTINKYTRWLTVPLAFIQSYGMILLLNQLTNGTLIPNVNDPMVILPMMVFITTGTVFLMWLGELITQKGLGNGISLIIFAGIIAGMPQVFANILQGGQFATDQKIVPFVIFCILSLIMLFVIILFTEGSRNIPITYAGKSGKNEKSGLPIRVNQAGMIPIIFAVSMITFPTILSQFLANAQSEWVRDIAVFFERYLNSTNPSYLYIVIYFLLVVGFSYFYVSITFNPSTVAENIQKRGGFIPGIRPGRQTAEYLEKVSNHLNLFGGTFLAIVAITPILFTKYTQLSSSDLIISGAGLIIVAGVVLEIIRQINAQLVMHDYDKLV